MAHKKKLQIPKRAKLISDGGLYRFIDMKELQQRITLPVMRNITLSDPEVCYSDTWRFHLTFTLVRITKSFAEYKQIDAVRVEVASPKK